MPIHRRAACLLLATLPFVKPKPYHFAGLVQHRTIIVDRDLRVAPDTTFNHCRLFFTAHGQLVTHGKLDIMNSYLQYHRRSTPAMVQALS